MLDALYIILFFIFGATFGSFFTVVGLRLPKKEKFIFDHSKCDSCKHQLPLYEMIPLLSYLFKKGKCSHCNNKIPPMFFFMELSSAILFAVSFYSFGLSLYLLIALGIVSMLIIITVSDLTYLIIPDEILIFFSIYFIVLQLFNIGLIDTFIHILNGLFLFLIMYIIMLLGNKVFKKESLGGGDVKMMFVFGLLLDPILGTLTIFFASLFALPIALILYYSNKEQVIPFGPFLVLSVAFLYFSKLDSSYIITWLGF